MNQKPSDTWSVERLGKFCLQSQKRMAVDAWRFGHALNLARAKVDHGEWKTWKQRYVPLLTHSSEHRYRTLAERLTEDSLQGVGLTEAYRLLDLTYSKSKAKGGELFPQAPVAVAANADDVGEDDPDDFDDLAVLPPATQFHDLPSATGLMQVEAEPEPPRMPTGPLEVEGEPEKEASTATARSPEERYKLYLMDGRQQMASLRSWTEWLMEQDEVFLFMTWRQHGVNGIGAEIAHTIERLQWLMENLDWS